MKTNKCTGKNRLWNIYMNVKQRSRKYQVKGHRVLIETEDDQSRKLLECFYYLHSLGCHLLAFHLFMIPTFILGERKGLLPSVNVIEKNATRNISTPFLLPK